MTFNEKRRAIREARKAKLLEVLHEAERDGKTIGWNEMAARTACPVTTVRVLLDDLTRKGLVTEQVIPCLQDIEIPDLQERIAIVREAKLNRWRKRGRRWLTGRELSKVLP